MGVFFWTSLGFCFEIAAFELSFFVYLDLSQPFAYNITITTTTTTTMTLLNLAPGAVTHAVADPAVSATDNLIRRTKAIHAGSVLPPFSMSFVADPAKVIEVTSALRFSTNTHVRNRTLAKMDLVNQFLFVAPGGKVYVFTCPTVGTDAANNAIVLGSMSDALDRVAPVSVPLKVFEGWAFSVVPEAAATLFDLPRYPELPDMTPGAPLADGTAGDLPSMARLDFGVDAVTALPVLAAVPVMLPIPVGVVLPVDAVWDISDPKPALEAVFPFYEVWRAAHAYMIRMNQGLSVTSAGPLFDPTAIAPVEFNLRLARAGLVTHTMISPTSPHYANVFSILEAATRSAWVRIADATLPLLAFNDPATTAALGLGPIGADPTVPAGSGVLGPWFPEVLGRLATSMEILQNPKPPVTKAESEQLVSAADVAAKFSLAFAHLEPCPNATDSPTVVPAKIRPEMMKVLEASKLTRAVPVLREQFETATRRAAATDIHSDRCVNISGAIADSV